MRIIVSKPKEGKVDIRIHGDLRQGNQQVRVASRDVIDVEAVVKNELERMFYDESLGPRRPTP